MPTTSPSSSLNLLICKMGHSTGLSPSNRKRKSESPAHSQRAPVLASTTFMNSRAEVGLLSCPAPGAYSWGSRLLVRKMLLLPNQMVSAQRAVWGLTRLSFRQPHGVWPPR